MSGGEKQMVGKPKKGLQEKLYFNFRWGPITEEQMMSTDGGGGGTKKFHDPRTIEKKRERKESFTS